MVSAAPTNPDVSAGLGHEFRSMMRVSYNQLLHSTRYRNKFRMELIAHVLILLPVILAAWAFSDGRESSRLFELTGLPDQFTFVILGSIAFTALGVGNMMLQDSHVAGGISFEMMTGTLERMFVMPVRRVTVVLGIGNYYLVLFTWQAVTLFIGAWIVFGFDPEITALGLAQSAWAFVVLLVMNMALGVMGAALTMATKDGQMYLLFIHRPAAIVSGAYFLIELMPQPFKALGYANPIAYAIDGFRGALTAEPLLVSSAVGALGVATAWAAGLTLLAVYVYRRMLRRMDAEGNLSFF